MNGKLKAASLYIVASISFLWSFFAIGYIVAVTFLQVPFENVRVVDQVLGFIMGTVAGSILQFWTGSSLGSKTKDEPKEETNE